MILTKKEKRVLRFLATTSRDFSINDLAKACMLAPSGAHKILKKLEKESVVKAKNIANLVSYKLDFKGNSTESVLHIAFVPEELEGRIKLRAQDLKLLKDSTQACILFGSYITAKEKPGDLDLLFILEKKNFKAYKQSLAKAKDLIPIKTQEVIQTREDVEQNLKKCDPVIVGILRDGIVLWGFDVLVQVIKDVQTNT
ncbi:MAG: helix-turn-helix domain-containing protein [Nanoarchaeota archaeon]|nr:helix-turn-helix domain-containing protein [Nanoarchaeota archaeon]